MEADNSSQLLRTLDAQATAALLPYGALVDALRAILVRRERGQIMTPQRMVVPLPHDGTLLVMPAASPALSLVKIVTVHPHNDGVHMPRVQADILVLDAATGRRLFLLDGDTVTARRTAALSLLAAQTVGAQPGPLLIVGAGTQARAHMHAFVEGLGVNQVYIASRTIEHAERLAAEARERWSITARAVPDVADVLDDVTLIVTATTSSVPVVPDAVRRDVFIAAVGAYRPSMAELAPELVRASNVYVDTIEGARAEAGDLIQADVDWARITPLARAIADAPRTHDGPVVFKSVGDAAWDLAAATIVAAALSQQEGLASGGST